MLAATVAGLTGQATVHNTADTHLVTNLKHYLVLALNLKEILPRRKFYQKLQEICTVTCESK